MCSFGPPWPGPPRTSHVQLPAEPPACLNDGENTFNGFEIFLTESQFSDGQVVDNDVEVGGSLGQESFDSLRNLVSLTEQLRSRKLSHDSSEDLVAEGR